MKGGGEGGQKSPKNGPHGLCTTPNLKIQYDVTLSIRVKQPSISNFFETSQPLRKIKQLTSFWVKK